MKKIYLLLLLFVSIVVIVILLYLGFVNVYNVQLTREHQISEIKKQWDQDNPQKVIELSESYLQKYPDDIEVLLLQGFAQFSHLYLSLNSNNGLDNDLLWRSIHSIRQAISMGVSDNFLKLSYYILGKEYYFLSGAYLEQSIYYLQKALDKGVKHVDIYEYLSSAYVDIGDPESAIKILEDSIETQPQLPLFISLIDIYFDLNKLDKVLEALTKSKKYTQTEIEKLAIRIRETRLDLANKRYSTAIKKFSDIIKIYPQSVEAHYYLGNAYEEQGNMSKARFEWRQAYKLSPYWDKVIEKLDQDITF